MAVQTGRIEVDAAELWTAHPPQIRDPKKLAFFELAGGGERTPTGTLAISRWTPGPIGNVGPMVGVDSVEGPFTYPEPEAGVDPWHVNFADPHLFAFYGTPAFAQDEIQVAEHPILASVRGRMLGDPSMPALTTDSTGPTPVLVRGVERWCAIDTSPPLAAPIGIYGQRLRRATLEMLTQAVTRLDAAPRTNLLAIAAPQGHGAYSEDDIREVLITAVTGFTAARLESARAMPGAAVRIHTGHWGTGAFGGNRVLMAAAQVLAARIAGIGAIAYHSLEEDGMLTFAEGCAIATSIPEGTREGDVVTALHRREFFWGRSDGN